MASATRLKIAGLVSIAVLATPAGAAIAPTPTPTATPVRHAAATEQPRARAPLHQPPPRGLAAAVVLDPIPAPIVIGTTVGLTGGGFTAGSVIVLFVAGATGVSAYGPFKPISQTPTALQWAVPTSVLPGNGFGTVVVVNTDQGFIQSNPRSQYLFGDAAQNLPTITGINGLPLRPFDQNVPLASVDTVITASSMVTITGTGFNNPKVNLFTATSSFVLDPLPGGTSTQIQVTAPASLPTGPGSFQVVNAPFTPNTVSNAVAVLLGAPLSITNVMQTGTQVTVHGTGFSSAAVINLFNLQGQLVFNLGGLFPTNGKGRVPLTVTPTQITFTVPPSAVSGPAYVQVINPPFVGFSNTGGDPDGAFTISNPGAARGGGSLHFFGNGTGDIDRVKIPLGDTDPGKPVDVGGNFTIELWLKIDAGNQNGSCTPSSSSGEGWINGDTIVDRDVFGAGADGDYGISLYNSGGWKVGFGVAKGASGATLCGNLVLNPGGWNHIAVTRNTMTGLLRLFVNGVADGSVTGPTGEVGYDNGRATSFPNSDPFLVLGAEKHDLGPSFPSFHGWVDELRVSSSIRYGGGFTVPAQPFVTDFNTVALYHFDEGNGNVIVDTASAAGGPSDGARRFGGSPAGPQWSPDTPFATGTPSVTVSPLPFSVNDPTSITNCGDNRLFITEQGGTIRIWDGTQLLPTPFLTVSPITAGGEQGLLSIAFHPQYAQNGYFFVYENIDSASTSIVRYHVSANPDIADPASRKVLLTVPQPATNHNGGEMQFGPDGYLYIAKGDGGGGCDSAGSGCNAQRDNLLLGKLLRIDVDQNVNAGVPPFYGIPPTNPFAGPGDPLDEIWAKGLRNPWRFTFDRLTGSLFIGDVGQGTREEVDYRPSDSPGGENYGWKRMEGFLCDTCTVTDCPVVPPPCNSPAYTLPILDYTHAFGCSITGGFVYRGNQIPFLYGKYLHGDLCSGILWWSRDNDGTWAATQFVPTANNLYTFGEDLNGELYIGRGGAVDTVSRLTP